MPQTPSVTTPAPVTGAPLPLNGTVLAIAIQADGKVLFCGDFTQPTFITRVNADLTSDNAFQANLGTGPNAAVRAITLQADQRIVIGGDFTSINGTPAGGIARLNADGTLDQAFLDASAEGFNGSVESLSMIGSERILAGGHFSTYGNSPIANVAAIFASGALDTAFAANLETQVASTPSTVPVFSPTPTPSATPSPTPFPAPGPSASPTPRSSPTPSPSPSATHPRGGGKSNGGSSKGKGAQESANGAGK